MNANTPYAGLPGTTPAGQRSNADLPELSSQQARALRRELAEVADSVRTYLPDEYLVGSELAYDGDGLRATVAVQPPVGHPVSAGFAPDPDAEEHITDDDREEVARGLAASAALQVKRAVQNDVTPTAR